jgi:hypothetical protein
MAETWSDGAGVCDNLFQAARNSLILNGEMSEWLKEHAWKACIRETVSRVRIPLSPPDQHGPFGHMGAVDSGDIGNTFGPNGFAIGSSLQASSSK